ncbi:MAG: hypothetical protein ACI9OJ_003053, partial [Myxococcota bacterium]
MAGACAGQSEARTEVEPGGLLVNTEVQPPLIIALLALSLSLGVFGACSDPQGSACRAGEACEKVLLNRCTCCPGFSAAECRQDRQERCSGGALVVQWFPDECEVLVADWADLKSNGTNPCGQFSEAELEQICQNFSSE